MLGNMKKFQANVHEFTKFSVVSTIAEYFFLLWMFLETDCDTPAQGLIGYSYQQVATSFPEVGLQRTPRLSVLGPEKFGDG